MTTIIQIFNQRLCSPARVVYWCYIYNDIIHHHLTKCINFNYICINVSKCQKVFPRNIQKVASNLPLTKLFLANFQDSNIEDARVSYLLIIISFMQHCIFLFYLERRNDIHAHGRLKQWRLSNGSICLIHHIGFLFVTVKYIIKHRSNSNLTC